MNRQKRLTKLDEFEPGQTYAKKGEPGKLYTCAAIRSDSVNMIETGGHDHPHSHADWKGTFKVESA